MTNQQLYLSVGIPSFLVVLAMLTNFLQTVAIGKRMDKLEDRMEKLDSRMNQLMQQMLTFRPLSRRPSTTPRSLLSARRPKPIEP